VRRRDVGAAGPVNRWSVSARIAGVTAVTAKRPFLSEPFCPLYLALPNLKFIG